MFKLHTYEAGSTSVTSPMGVTLVTLNSSVGGALPLSLVLWHHTCLDYTSWREVIALKCSISAVIHILLTVYWFSPGFLYVLPPHQSCPTSSLYLGSRITALLISYPIMIIEREKMKAMCHLVMKDMNSDKTEMRWERMNLMARIRPANYPSISCFLLRIFP